MSQGAAWDAAFDDLLVERWRHCTRCGRTGIVWEEIVPVTRTLAVAVVLCGRCRHDTEGTASALAALFAQRYGLAGGSGSV